MHSTTMQIMSNLTLQYISVSSFKYQNKKHPTHFNFQHPNINYGLNSCHNTVLCHHHAGHNQWSECKLWIWQTCGYWDHQSIHSTVQSFLSTARHSTAPRINIYMKHMLEWARQILLFSTLQSKINHINHFNRQYTDCWTAQKSRT